MKMVVLIRHGQSMYNLLNKFTGWADVELSEKGIKEAKDAGIALKLKEFNFDMAYTSYLKRAQDTLKYILEELDETNIETVKSWKLNERSYGALQGFSKAEMDEKYGKKQVLLWRRSNDIRPPALDIADSRFPGNDPKYKDIAFDELPKTENLIDTMNRVLKYWQLEIEPKIKIGRKVIVAAHGNVIRGLIKHFDNISDEDILHLEVQTGNPICYEFDDDLNPIRHYYIKE